MHRPWPWARVLAHRGGGTLAPENTIGAIRVGIEHGYRAIEFDAMLPRDDAPILMHDPWLGRTVAGTGAITEYTAAELTRLDAGRWHSPRFRGEPVPTLEDALAFCRREGVWCNVEIKPAPGREAATGRVVAMTVAAAWADRVRRGRRAAGCRRTVGAAAVVVLDRRARIGPRGASPTCRAAGWSTAFPRIGARASTRWAALPCTPTTGT